jgi:F0F1-type ATP synthase membrane subunit b/b'
MTEEWLSTGLIVGSLLAAGLAFIYVAVKLSGPRGKKGEAEYGKRAEEDVEHIFNEDFREELRNRGKLHFEKIISENTMFLKEDLRLTTSQVNDYLKGEVNKILQDSLAQYQKSIDDAKQLTMQSLQKTQDTLEQQRQALGEQLKQEISEEKARILQQFEKSLGEIAKHYISQAVANQLSLDNQIEFILSELENNKQNIIADINQGA